MKCFLLLVIILSMPLAYADTILVTSLSDSGSNTLRDAITNATHGDTIQFDGSLSGTITLASSLPDIAVNYLTITGPLSNNITIDGASLYRIFNVQATPFTVSNLNLNNGADAAQGGVVHVNAENYAYLTSVTISPAAGLNGENSLFAETNGVLDLTDVTLPPSSAPQVYLNRGSLNITSNINLQFVIDGIGEAQVYKYGNGATSISIPASVTSDFYLVVVNGLVSFSGSIFDSCSIFTNGTLNCMSNMLEISNQGTLLPGDPSTFFNIILSNSYIVDNGTTKIKVNPSGSVDTIQTSGDIYLLGGPLTILPQSGTYIAGTTYTFLTTTGGVNGTFTSVSAGGLNVQINYFEQSVEIEILTTITI